MKALNPKSFLNVFRAFNESGRQDLNLRPLGPEAVSPARHGRPPVSTRSLSADIPSLRSAATRPGAKPGERVRGETEPRFLPGLSPGGLRSLPGLPERLLTVTEVAGALKVSKATVYKLCQQGQLPHSRISNAVRIAPRDLSAFLSGRCQLG